MGTVSIDNDLHNAAKDGYLTFPEALEAHHQRTLMRRALRVSRNADAKAAEKKSAYLELRKRVDSFEIKMGPHKPADLVPLPEGPPAEGEPVAMPAAPAAPGGGVALPTEPLPVHGDPDVPDADVPDADVPDADVPDADPADATPENGEPVTPEEASDAFMDAALGE